MGKSSVSCFFDSRCRLVQRRGETERRPEAGVYQTVTDGQHATFEIEKKIWRKITKNNFLIRGTKKKSEVLEIVNHEVKL